MDPHSSLATLTQYEKLALQAQINLSDGHAHQSPTSNQLEILTKASEHFASPRPPDQVDVEETFLRSFFSLSLNVGIESAMPWMSRTQICYSASLAMEVVANVLRLSGKRRVLVLQPTFDNIPSILTRHGLSVIAVYDEDIANDPTIIATSEVDAVVIVAPNNPTGQSFDRSWFDALARIAEARGVVIVSDFAFRLFDPSMRWNQYDLFDGCGVSYLAIEDLGKIWPTQDLKVGLLIASEDLNDIVDRVHDDFILNASPFTLRLLTKLSNDGPPDAVLQGIREIPRRNRLIVNRALTSVGFLDETRMASISVAWMRLPISGGGGDEVCAMARSKGVHVLPGHLFYFQSKDAGQRYIRLALMRDAAVVTEGCKRLKASASGTD